MTEEKIRLLLLILGMLLVTWILTITVGKTIVAQGYHFCTAKEVWETGYWMFCK